jgi:hypothetical protein
MLKLALALMAKQHLGNLKGRRCLKLDVDAVVSPGICLNVGQI